MINTIIFDLGMVLVGYCWREYLESFHYPKEIEEEIANAMFLSKEWNEFDRSLVSDDEILASFIKNRPEREKEIKEVFENIGGVIRKYDYARPWIRELKEKGYKVYYLSNFAKRTFEQAWDIVGFIEETHGGVLSYEIKMVKPEPGIYETLLRKYDIVPENAVFLDDSKGNVEAARKFGLHTIEFTTRDEAIKELKALGIK